MLIQKPTQPRAILSALKYNDLDILEYVDQVELHFNSVEPQIESFVAEENRFERLRADAIRLQNQYPDPESRPSLYGLLIGVKDIFHAEGFLTQAGSNLPPSDLGGPEATAVSLLKDAGALVLGKTVTTEFAYFSPGPTKNPHNTDHTPGGSSSGSAAAVAAGLTPFAFGTQTIGSIARPASFCGVYGYKPSFNRISKRGVIPLSNSLDHVGFFTPDLVTARVTANVLIDDWNNEETVKSMPVIGIPGGPYLQSASSQMLSHFETLSQKLQFNGFTVITIPTMLDYQNIVERHNLIVAAEASRNHAALFDKYASLYRPKLKELILKGKEITDDQLAEAINGKITLRNRLEEIMNNNKLDLWISPSAVGPAPFGLDATGDPIMNLPWTQSGLPTLTIPAGFTDDRLPLGLQIAAGWMKDESLFAWGLQLVYALR